jgi:hypothetical protein
LLRSQAKHFRESGRTNTVRIWEEHPKRIPADAAVCAHGDGDRRRAAVETATALMRLEGMGEQPPEIKALDEEFIAG